MTFEEKRAWIRLVVAVAGYAVYAVIVGGRLGERPVGEVAYAPVLLWTVLGAIAAAILAEIGLAVVNPRASRAVDVRDREIGRFADHVGHAFVVIGALAGMLMAMAGLDGFWVANVIYLCFVLSTVLGSVAKIGVYHGSFPQW